MLIKISVFTTKKFQCSSITEIWFFPFKIKLLLSNGPSSVKIIVINFSVPIVMFQYAKDFYSFIYFILSFHFIYFEFEVSIWLLVDNKLKAILALSFWDRNEIRKYFYWIYRKMFEKFDIANRYTSAIN